MTKEEYFKKENQKKLQDQHNRKKISTWKRIEFDDEKEEKERQRKGYQPFRDIIPE
jgi:hypothetical protein